MVGLGTGTSQLPKAARTRDGAVVTETGRQADRRRLNNLVGGDGSVQIPARLTPWVRSLLEAALSDIRRAGRGGALAGDVLDILDALAGADIGSAHPAGETLKVGQLVTVAQAAQVLECGERAVRLALQEGRLTGVKTGGRHWVIFAHDLHKYRFTKGARNG